ncbi:MAG: phosphate signaling complex protein PhoU [Gaiellaceae bacterium]
MRELFETGLQTLEVDLQHEVELVSRRIRSAVNVLRRNDLELAAELIAVDAEVDSAYLAIEQEVQSLLVRQAPVARDFRLVLAILHINLHLERMADLCVTIAKLVQLTSELPREEGVLGVLTEMGERADEMLRTASDAFTRRDADLARSLVGMDELIDRANRRLVERLIDIGADEGLREWGLRMLLASRCLERIGDHSVDIGEQVAYLVEGQFEEFTDASEPDASIR